MLLDLAGVDGITLGVNAGGDHVGTLVHVGEKESWADAGLGVKTRATISMTTRAYLEIERTVHPVLFRPKYRRQVLRHVRSFRSVLFHLSILRRRISV